MKQMPQRQQPAQDSLATKPAGQDAFQAPAIALPTGGGAIRGIDEKFQVNPATGSGAMTIPVAVSASRQGFNPQLSLSYDSGSGASSFGLGWGLALPQISRKTDKGLPTYLDGEESDVFMFSGAEDLVPVLVEDGGGLTRHSQPRTVGGTPYRVQRYRPRIEGAFARIERWTNQDTGETHWRSISRDNVTILYGQTPESRIANPDDPLQIFSWLICESYDDKGNAILYRYKSEDTANIDLSAVHERNRTPLSRSANRYLKRICYGNQTPHQPEEVLSERADWMFEVVFDYGEGHLIQAEIDDEGRQIVETSIGEQQPWPVRQDPLSRHRSGFEVRTYRLCRRILMFHHFPDELGTPDYLVRATHFDYAESPVNTMMTGAVQSGYQRQTDGRYQECTLPPLEFEYSRAEIQSQVHDIDLDSLENLPSGLSGPAYRWVDLDGEGISGILTEQGNGWFYKPNLGSARFAPQEQVAVKPSLAALSRGQQLLDLAGDGQLDLVMFAGPAPGFYERTEDQSWADHKAFASVPSTDWDDPNLRFVDLTGDGHADLLITEDRVLTWYPSLAEEGFGSSQRAPQYDDDETGPRLLFADADQSIYLADMSGDGLVDLVRIRNGSVCYWPSLGYGRFGAKVSMDNSPWFDTPDGFAQQWIRLADVDGSGISDILYLHHDRVAIYFNEAGNSWASAQMIEYVPGIDRLSDVTVTDLLGNGTACLVWSSPLPGDTNRRMCYIDLMDGQKPHLLIGARNNLGAETRVQYAASTQFYLQDRADGHPWITRLPFPVHVIERVETYDHTSRNRFVSRYRYHHGYFDGIEREFRGFGMVEQIDTEEFAALSSSIDFPVGVNVDEASHMPPVLTRSWFHTGAYIDEARISRLFESEYYREPGLSDGDFRDQLLPDTVMPPGLTTAAQQEAARSLKGSMLRQEVYGLDGSSASEHPYTVTEQNLAVELLQPHGPNRHAVFFTHTREALSYHYERNPADPRIGHTCALAVDAFGNVLQSAAVGYGRREADGDLSPPDQDRQRQVLITCAENAFTNVIEEDDVYRASLPAQSTTYELTGLDLTGGQHRFDFAQLRDAITSAAEIPYHAEPAPDTLQKRVLGRSRLLYRRDDMSGPLPLGQIESLALPFESYQLAFTPEHLTLVFGDRVTESTLSDEGRYVHLAGNDNWWIPSGRTLMSPGPADSPAQELAFARQHFFLSLRFRDPFGEMTAVEYDSHDLLLIRTVDPLQNSLTARCDYRLLSPDRLTDPNGNRSAVAFDVLGMVAGTALMGPELTGDTTENSGDTLEEFQGQLTQTQIDALFENPRGPIAADLLGSATSRIVYDVGRFQRLGQPPFAATIARETHAGALGSGEASALQISLSYADGFGRIIQKKVQAEPGQVEAGGDPINLRWVASGWTIFNNKGKPIRQYEPFFSASHDFEFGVTVGVSSILLYDPAGRVVATLHPNHTWGKVIFTPWRQQSWDMSDTVLVIDPAADPDVGGYFQRLEQAEYLPTWHQSRINGDLGSAEQDAAQKAGAHADTPAVVHFDSLGRAFLSIADNGADGQYATRSERDIEGSLLRVIDDRGNSVMAYQVGGDGSLMAPGYDVAGRQIYENSMDAGEGWSLPDVSGKPVRIWDSRGHVRRLVYDELQRLTHLFVTQEGHPEMLAEVTVYGEPHPEAQDLNLRGQIYQVYDGAGVATSRRFDFKGNLLENDRRLTGEYRSRADWSVLVGLTQIDAIESAAAPLLETEVFTTQTAYDALNRPTAITAPDGSATLPTYNEANYLERMAVRIRDDVQTTLFVDNIDYNARGQRERITYATADGSNFTTTYEYDPLTFRLIRLHTLRHGDGFALQDLHYVYGPMGNITSIRDDAQQSVFFDNIQIEPHTSYTYDALYRLTRAEGREHAVQNNLQRDAGQAESLVGIPFPNSPEALQHYVEIYGYDSVGNILSMRHIGGDTERWTRRYQYAENSNRLLATSLPGDAEGQFSAPYSYDAHGNMTSMPHLPLIAWDFEEQLQATSRQVMGDGTPETTHYAYNALGERIRKVTDRQAGAGQTPTRHSERLYLGGFEVYREYGVDGSSVMLERETLHVVDGQKRIAQVDTRTQGSDEAPARSLRFQLSNHLGSATLEVDEQAAVISYEEYHPYGTSAYRSGRTDAEVSLKRYRYTGKERDEESDLYYHGARYYACWLGRWTAVDPFGLGDGIDCYAYGGNNPVRFRDIGGMAGEPFQPGQIITKEQFEATYKGEAKLAENTIALKLPSPGEEHLVVPVSAVVYDPKLPGDEKHVGVSFNATTRGSYWYTKYALAATKLAMDRQTQLAAGRILASKKMIQGVTIIGVVGGLTGGIGLSLGTSSFGGSILLGMGEGAVSNGLTEAGLTWLEGGSAKEIVSRGGSGIVWGGGLGAIGGAVGSLLGKLKGPQPRFLSDVPANPASATTVSRSVQQPEESFEGLIDNAEFSNDPVIIDRLSRAREFDIGGYHDLTGKGRYGRVGDNLDSDEALQNAFIRENKGVSRVSELTRDNPAMALSPTNHGLIKNLKTPELRKMTAVGTLKYHLNQMRKFVPEFIVNTLEKESLRFIQANNL